MRTFRSSLNTAADATKEANAIAVEPEHKNGYQWTALSVTTVGALLGAIQGSALLIKTSIWRPIAFRRLGGKTGCEAAPISPLREAVLETGAAKTAPLRLRFSECTTFPSPLTFVEATG